jgi:hypothetical protein
MPSEARGTQQRGEGGADSENKTGETLATMKERGELAEHVGRNGSQAATHSLEDLGLTRSQSSRYQQEASAKPTRQRETPVDAGIIGWRCRRVNYMFTRRPWARGSSASLPRPPC